MYSAVNILSFRVHIDLSLNKLLVNPEVDLFKILNILDMKDIEVCIVDIDRAKKTGNQFEILKKIALKFPNRFLVSGGITTVGYANQLLGIGFKGVVVGSVFYKNGKIDYDMIKCFSTDIPSSKLHIAIDFFDNYIVQSGFNDISNFNVESYIHLLDKSFSKEISFCLTNSQAALRQSSFNMPKNITNIFLKLSPRKFLFGGGIKSRQDIEKVLESKARCIIGMSLLKGERYLSKTMFRDINLYHQWLKLVNNKI